MLLHSLVLRLSVTDTLPIITCPTAAIHKPEDLQEQIFALLVVLPLPNKFFLKGYKQTNKIFKVTFSKFKIIVALKTYLPRRDRHKEHDKIFPSCSLEDATSFTPLLCLRFKCHKQHSYKENFLQHLSFRDWPTKSKQSTFPKSILLK